MRTLTPPSVMMYAAWTRETIVVTIQVENMTMRRRRSIGSDNPFKSFSGAKINIESAMTSAKQGKIKYRRDSYSIEKRKTDKRLDK